MRSDVTLHKLFSQETDGAWVLKTPVGSMLLLRWIQVPETHQRWRAAIAWSGGGELSGVADWSWSRDEAEGVRSWIEAQDLCEIIVREGECFHAYTHPFKTRRELIQVICAALDRSETAAAAVSEPSSR